MWPKGSRRRDGIDDALARVRSRADVLRMDVREGDPPLELPRGHFGRVELGLHARGLQATVAGDDAR